MKKMTAGDIGAMCELRACQWLMERGVDVFRNQSPNGISDIITLDPENMEIVCYDVKAMRAYHKKDGTISYMAMNLKAEQIKKGIKRIAVCGDLILIDDGVSPNLNKAVSELLE